MGKRIYNVIFDLHTVSGIVISVVLFVIFFAGSFSFFRDEIVNWERNEAVEYTEHLDMDFDTAFDSLESKYNLAGRDISITKGYIEQRIRMSLEGSKDSLSSEEDKARQFFYMDVKSYQTSDYASSYSLGEFLYRLHFLAQIPHPVGYYLSGFTAFFFLFALITGIIIHWEKIISNFYLFRPWAKLKTFWTDAHTALGTIGLPFQLLYALTGAFFMIKGVLIAPSVYALYEGNESALYEDLGYSEPAIDYSYERLSDSFSINELVLEVEQDWPKFNINHLHIFNYGDANMHVSIEGEADRRSKLVGPGKRLYKVASGEIIDEKDPKNETSYRDGVFLSMFRMHYADYGGYALKIISFLLGLISCFVILSGVMIWLVARDKKNVPEKRRRFNEWVVRIYMAICLSMYPVTAAAFIAVKVFGQGMVFIYQFYFLSWLVTSMFFVVKKDLDFINRTNLLWGSLIGVCIPIVNGLVSGQWLWASLSEGNTQVLFIDMFWLVLSVGTFLIYVRLRRKGLVQTDVKQKKALLKKSDIPRLSTSEKHVAQPV